MKGLAAAIGMFDGVHLGHQALVRDVGQAAHERGLESAIFTFPCHPLSLIRPEAAPRLITTPGQKRELLMQAGAEHVHMLDFGPDMRRLTAAQFMQHLRDAYGVTTLLVGFNHRFGSDRLTSIDDYRQAGAGVGVEVLRAGDAVMRDGLPVSSSAVRAALAEGRIADANAMLGRNFAIQGTVDHGMRLGRTIGFPTANVTPLQASQLIPKLGVYAGWAHVGTERHRAMVNVGTRPTIDSASTHPLSIEAHLIDYDADLYGMPIEIELAHRLRDEQKFPSLAALTAQLASDKLLTTRLLPE